MDIRCLKCWEIRPSSIKWQLKHRDFCSDTCKDKYENTCYHCNRDLQQLRFQDSPESLGTGLSCDRCLRCVECGKKGHQDGWKLITNQTEERRKLGLPPQGGYHCTACQ